MTAPTIKPPRADGETRPPAVAGAAARRRRNQLLPYGLLTPSLVVLGLVLVYPLFRLGLLSVQKFGLKQQFGAPPDFVGLDNYQRIAKDLQFWSVLTRTIVFCGVTVAATLVIGMLIALMIQHLGRPMRLAVMISLLLAWAMPPVSATVVWQWMFDSQYGLINWALGTEGRSWLDTQISFFTVAAIIVVWMGVPFVAFTLYAGLTQVPKDLIEAAQLDGATALQRFRLVTVPLIKPVILILTALSVLWNFRVFTQIYVLQKAGGISRDTNVLGVFAYRISIGENRFDVGAAVAVVMVVITLLLTVVYLRQMAQQEEL
jgi:N,N'-diacetylchitobiose transport system permease protein